MQHVCLVTAPTCALQAPLWNARYDLVRYLLELLSSALSAWPRSLALRMPRHRSLQAVVCFSAAGAAPEQLLYLLQVQSCRIHENAFQMEELQGPTAHVAQDMLSGLGFKP